MPPLLHVEVGVVADVDPDGDDGAAGEGAGIVTLLADIVTAVEPDARPVARERDQIQPGRRRNGEPWRRSVVATPTDGDTVCAEHGGNARLGDATAIGDLL